MESYYIFVVFPFSLVIHTLRLQIKTIIDTDTHIVGNINVDGSLRVDGTVDGDILKPVLHAGFS